MRRWKTWSVGTAAALFLAVLPSARPQDTAAGSGSLEQTVSELKDRVAVLEQGTAQPAREVEGAASPVKARLAYDDHQEAAPRPDDLTLDPKYRGFIPVPHTEVMIKFNAKPRVDLTWDPQNTGNDDRFVTADIPVEGDAGKGGGARFNLNGKGSQIRVDVRAPQVPGNPRFYYQNDFFGSGGGNFPYRIQHLYGQYYNIIAGQTYSVFEDPDIWPETVDYEGPNAAISDRRPLVSYQLPLDDQWHMNFGLEKPDSAADGASETIHPSPDCTVNARWEKADVGHLQFSGILRALAARDAGGDKQTIFGWGVNGSAGLEITPDDAFQAQLVYGEGIGSLGNDTSFLNGPDAAYEGDGDLQAVPYFSVLAGITHRWSEKLRSTASYGYVNLSNEDAQEGSAYHRTQYASANLVYQILPRLSIGLEGLYGSRETKDGS
ncbi:MAG: DcaP family trimeric outer membrane transporter, partial [Candidatus Aureabacteria bacterium]|nr:DcaP family trimeric outer membrane transporter [Candidatus Auribacterota bacterium]